MADKIRMVVGGTKKLRMLRSRSGHAQEPVNSATHERSTIIQGPPVAESAGDEHATAGEPVRVIATAETRKRWKRAAAGQCL